jgi:acetylornithine deacetylase
MQPLTLSRHEEKVMAAVRDGQDQLIALLSDLVAFDTTARNPGDPPRDEAAFQRYLRDRLIPLGAECNLWEPPPTGKADRLVPDDLDFAGRPQLAANVPGHGRGRSLLLNGHIDAVSAEPLEDWTSNPFSTEIRDGEIYGRGTCDMKGGIAGMLFALETLHRLDVKLSGDVIFCTDTDEESGGAGSQACIKRGVKADAGLCGEPTGFDVWVACRGTGNPVLTIEGRAGHAECTHPHWRDGGPVNAIEKLAPVLQAVRDLRDDWRLRSEHRHPYLNPPDIVPTVLHAGEWMVTYPASCELVFDVQYMPCRVNAAGNGQDVFDEVERRIEGALLSDPWFAEHPVRWRWPLDTVPAEVPDDHPVVALALEAAEAVGRSGVITGMDAWHDAAAFTRWAGTPTVSFGPGDLLVAHAIDEHVPVRDLVDHAAAVAVALMRWCGVSG